ncbi:MAG: response regulator [Chitinophagaceae bacterium]|nr:response regulator [Chitinophagaceae bacterium]
MSKTIILIDDDSDDLYIMKTAIAAVDSAALCLSFIYPDEALRVLLSQELVFRPNYVFIDINMPVTTGDKCLRELRANRDFDDVFIAMYSTSMPEPVAETLLNFGANYTFEKPAHMSAYSKIINEILHPAI